MNTVWNSYGQLLQLPEKTSKKMQIFCRGLDIRVSQIVETHLFHSVPLNKGRKLLRKIIGIHSLSQFIHKYISVVLIVVAVAADLQIGRASCRERV